MTVTIIDGTFWINGVDTGISPEGQPGAPGEDGQDGVGIEDITFTAGEDGTVVTIL